MNVVSPEATKQLLEQDAAAQYIDVRTVGEFAQGRPLLRAVNLPYVFHAPQSAAEVPNGSFIELVSFLFPPTTPLVLGGGADDRAARAAEALAAAGFDRLSVMSAGFEGWRAALLPTTRDNREGISYVSLLTRFRRKDKRGAAKAAPAH